MLPLGGLAIAVFTGWAISDRLLAEELQLGNRVLAALRLLLRGVVPVSIVLATVASLL
jgi:neurotransmitter:Na+ symporter, NSS family